MEVQDRDIVAARMDRLLIFNVYNQKQVENPKKIDNREDIIERTNLRRTEMGYCRRLECSTPKMDRKGRSKRSVEGID